MADYTAIFEAGNGIVEYLQDVLTPEPISKKEMITLCSPYEPENSQLTVYMYSIEEDQSIYNNGAYKTTGIGTAAVEPTMLKAGFIITAHSNAPAHLKEADRCRIIGAAIQAIKDMPVLDRKYLTGSLGRSNAKVYISMEHVSHEDMMKIWNNSQVPYKTSIVVRVNGITIDSKRSMKISRVTDVSFGVNEKRETT